MRLLVVILFIIVAFISCKEDITYQSQILIKNETSSLLTISLFPKSEYMNGDFYYVSALNRGSNYTEFDLEIDKEHELYITGDLKKNPNIIATEVFDSIHVISPNDNSLKIRFSPDRVIGYSENLFSDDSEWLYELRSFNLRTNFRRNPVESHDYIFTISEYKY